MNEVKKTRIRQKVTRINGLRGVGKVEKEVQLKKEVLHV